MTRTRNRAGGVPREEHHDPQAPKKRHPGAIAAFLGLLLVFPITTLMRVNGAAGTPSAGVLRVQRQQAIETAIRSTLRDPESATFSFQDRGGETLRARVRAQNGFGAYSVQVFDFTFPFGSVVGPNVREVK